MNKMKVGSQEECYFLILLSFLSIQLTAAGFVKKYCDADNHICNHHNRQVEHHPHFPVWQHYICVHPALKCSFI